MLPQEVLFLDKAQQSRSTHGVSPKFPPLIIACPHSKTNDGSTSIDWEGVRGTELHWGQAGRAGESHLISRHAGSRALDLFQAPYKGALTVWVMLTASPQRERECQAREMKHVSLSPSTQPKWMAQHLAISDIPIWGKNGRVELDVINHHNLLQFPKTNMTGWNYFAVLRQSFAEPIKCQYKSEDEIYLIWRSRYHLSIYCVYQELSCNDTMALQVAHFISAFKTKNYFIKILMK